LSLGRAEELFGAAMSVAMSVLCFATPAVTATFEFEYEDARHLGLPLGSVSPEER
jgi:hypothetical protein